MKSDSTATMKISRGKSGLNNRIHEIDLIRGLCMFLVFMDHFFWNLLNFGRIWSSPSSSAPDFFVNVYKAADFYWSSPYRVLVQIFVLCTFLFVSGISTAFSKSNWKRAGHMLAFYFIIQLGTNLIAPYWEESIGSSAIINFNVIGVVAWSVLFYSFIQEKSWRSLIVTIFILGIFYIVFLPAIYNDLYENHRSALTYINAWPLWQTNGSAAYHEADYMPLFPYIILFFIGALFSRFFYKERKSLFGRMQGWERPICFVGRHSLIFYLTHQIIFVGLFALVGLITGWGIR